MNIICPCCQGKAVVAAGAPVKLTRSQNTIYLTVRAAAQGVPVSKLLSILFDDRIDGGPDNGFQVLRSHVWKLNQALAAVGERVRAGQGVYRLHRLSGSVA